jgi:hypothetical protein
MRKHILIVLLSVTSILVSGSVKANEVSDVVRRECRAVADNVAKIIFDARDRGVEYTVNRPSADWGEQVRHFMVHSAKESKKLTQQELATAGFTYCVERRPVG